MRKPKLYLETSAISHLEQPEKPSEHAYSIAMFERIKAGDFAVYLSKIVVDEINACNPEKRSALFQHVSEITYEDIPVDDTVEALADRIIERGYLPKSSVRDSYHIAAGIIAGCDYIVSWNMKHMANVKINKNIRYITIEEGYKEILLVPPSMILGGGVLDEGDE